MSYFIVTKIGHRFYICLPVTNPHWELHISLNSHHNDQKTKTWGIVCTISATLQPNQRRVSARLECKVGEGPCYSWVSIFIQHTHWSEPMTGSHISQRQEERGCIWEPLNNWNYVYSGESKKILNIRNTLTIYVYIVWWLSKHRKFKHCEVVWYMPYWVLTFHRENGVVLGSVFRQKGLSGALIIPYSIYRHGRAVHTLCIQPRRYNYLGSDISAIHLPTVLYMPACWTEWGYIIGN